MNVVVSDQDRATLAAIAPGSEISIIPNGVDTSVMKPISTAESGSGVVFVGGCSWFPNTDAMSYYCIDILPLIRDRLPGCPFTWIGRVPERVRRRYEDEFNIEVTGYVEDVKPGIDRARCFVVPLRVGGGTRLKILDAWAMGKAVVSTSIGCVGLRAVNGENIMVRDEPASFADAVVEILEDDALISRISELARATAEQIYEWEIIGGAMVDRYNAILRSSR